MDLNTILLIAFAVMMLFCCGGLGRLFRRGDDRDAHLNENDHTTAGSAPSGKKVKSGHRGCCH